MSASCSVDDSLSSARPGSTPDWVVARSGDATTTFEVSVRSFNLSARNMGLPARVRFARGDRIFETFFDPATGLGPDFNATGCNSCHVDNARQADAVGEGPLGEGPVVHVSAPGADIGMPPLDLPGYGVRLQTRSLDGTPEAEISVHWVEVAGTYPDGAGYSLRRPTLEIVGHRGAFPADAQTSLRIPPQVAGPGMLELIAESDIIAAADPSDADSDGISGRVQWTTDSSGRARVGRHGWKAENFDLVHQTAGALFDDSGIANSVASPGLPTELSDTELADDAFYVEALAIPAGRDVTDPDIGAGARLFEQVGCSSCHAPVQRTGDFSIPEFANLTIHPFSDLLLHDLGTGLDDHRPVLQASGAEWRTAPLWGIGLLETVNGQQSLLHDGRARNVEEAILWHGGEAQRITDQFRNLTAHDRELLIGFVNSR